MRSFREAASGLLRACLGLGVARSALRRPFNFHAATIVLFGLAAVVVGDASDALAASPTVKIGTATPVDPSKFATLYDLTSPAFPTLTDGTTRDPLVQERARSLGYNIDNIVAFVRDHVEFTPLSSRALADAGVTMNIARRVTAPGPSHGWRRFRGGEWIVLAPPRNRLGACERRVGGAAK